MRTLVARARKLFLPAAAFGLATVLYSATALAIPTMVPKLKDHEIRIGLAGNSYLTKTTESSADAGTGNLALTVGVRGIGRKENFHFGVEGETLYGLRNSNYRYVDVGELYAGFEKKEAPRHFFGYAGRKRFEWNQLDSYWGMGLYQPRFRWDYLNERENGLFGFFGGYKGEWLEATAFATPIFIPEQGAPFDITGGDCHSSSPWFSCPAATVRIFNQNTAVRFSLDVPPVKDIVLHKGAGATVRVGKALGPFSRLSYTYKPMNQFLLSFEGRLNLATSDIPAVIRPRVVYAHLLGGDFGYVGQRNSITASAIAERPIRDTTPATFNTQEAANAELFGVTAKTVPLDSMKFTRFEVSALHRNGGNASDRGPFVTPGIDTFEPRYAFKNALSFAVFSPFNDDWARRFLFSTKFIVDTVNQGNLLVTDFYYSPVAAFIINLGMDMLGSNSTSPVDFLSRYQRNDRIRGGVAYAF